jgi:hypothetical protein
MPRFVVASLVLVAGLAAGVAVSRGAASAGPAATGPPFAVGAAVVGQRLTAEPGTWTGSGTIAFHYQWSRCDVDGAHCASIHGATGRSYKVVTADAGHTLALAVGATDSGGTTNAYAGVLGPVALASSPLVSTVQPTATGTVAAGTTVQVDGGTWSAKTDSLAYGWLRCNANGRLCASIAGASAQTYTVTAADTGHVLVALVTATAGGRQVSAVSSPVRPPQAPAASTTTTTTTAKTTTGSTGGPRNSARPTVAGSAVQGIKLVATAGSWAGSGTISYAYQWYRCDTQGAHCGSIHGATAATYTLVAADLAHTIGLTVNATDSTGKASAYASLAGPVAAPSAPLFATVQPAASGTATPGKTVTISSGTWSQTPSGYEYAWQRCNANGRLCTAISGATSATYTVTTADRGHQLLALVQASAGSASAQALSSGIYVP